jgi:pimeloyl-ACP methyl ester carboxylesterase
MQGLHGIIGNFVLNILNSVEEGLKVVVRELIIIVIRIINGIANCILFLFGLKSPSVDTNKFRRDWVSWRANKATEENNFNALVEIHHLQTNTDSKPKNSTRKQTSTNGNNTNKYTTISTAAPAPPIDLFKRPAGSAIPRGTTGLIEDTRLTAELTITAAFEGLRNVTRTVLMLKEEEPDTTDLNINFTTSTSTNTNTNTMKRNHSYNNSWEELKECTASDVITACGYPLEELTLTTEDGYILQIQRMPRRGSKDVVFFMHGVLDTSLGWVASGGDGSQAFGLHDAGFDVFLGNTRSNPPRSHIDSEYNYWNYSLNELGMKDVAAQIEYIHQVKMAELGGGSKGNKYNSRNGTTNTTTTTNAAINTLRLNSGSTRTSSASSTAGVAGTSFKRSFSASTIDTLALDGGSPPRLLAPLPSSSSASLMKNSLPLLNELCMLTPDKISQSMATSTSVHNDEEEKEADEGLQDTAASGSTPNNDDDDDDDIISEPPTPTSQQQHLPYKLQVVGHSLGAASLLIYAVTQSLGDKKPHYINRMVLLCPAGFHKSYPRGAAPLTMILPSFMTAMRALYGGHSGNNSCISDKKGGGGAAAAVYVPSSMLRHLTFKLAADIVEIPALAELTRSLLRLLLNGDASEWDRALAMPHYSRSAMPAISLNSGEHLIQLINTKEFKLYDYNSPAVNTAHYGTPTSTNIAEHYGELKGVAVDLVAGSQDGVISSEDVLTHYRMMDAAEVAVTYKEFDCGHLDMTFAHKDEIRRYVLNRCLLGRKFG